jgi:hypothetical protein
MSLGNLKRSFYTSFNLGQIRSDTNNVVVIQNDPTVVNFSQNGVTMTLKYYIYLGKHKNQNYSNEKYFYSSWKSGKNSYSV